MTAPIAMWAAWRLTIEMAEVMSSGSFPLEPQIRNRIRALLTDARANWPKPQPQTPPQPTPPPPPRAPVEKEPALINTAIEDALAHAMTENERHQILHATLLVVSQYLARETGVYATVRTLGDMAGHIRSDKPAKPYPP